MSSSGGIVDAGTARSRPIETLLSGPAAGVRGAAHVAGRHDAGDLLTMDMGGTSCDVSLVEGGEPLVTTDVEVGEYPVAVPMVDVHTVGAGGGSVAWIDDGGALRVGPRSAGADPGPICYGRGGTAPTVTDAHAVLGRIDPAVFVGEFGGAVDEAGEALETLGERLGLDRRETAAGVLEVANANTARALRVVSVERGYDPRGFSLVAFGGAGPLHAVDVAADVGVPEVLVPRAAGSLSALGLLVSDLTYEVSRSRVRPWREVDPAELASLFESFERETAEQVPEGLPVRHERFVDLRYEGQSFDLRVPLPGTGDDDSGASRADGDPSAGRSLDDEDLASAADRFHQRHEARYGHASPGEPVELVTVRVRTRGVVDPPAIEPPTGSDAVDDAVRESRTVRFGSDRETRVFDRDRLPTERRGDLRAQVAANETGAERFRDLVDRYGIETLTDALDAVVDYSERRMRSELAEIPDGEYRFEDVLDDGRGHDYLPIVATVAVSGDDVVVDFEGTAAQTEGPVNAVFAVTASATYYAVRAITDPDIPPNAGCYRPIEIETPAGSIVNPDPPVAVVGGNLETSQRVTDVVLGAFAEAVPDRAVAAGQGTMNNVTFGGSDL